MSSALLFFCHQVAHFGGGEIGAEAQAEIVEVLGRAEDALDARAIGGNEPPRVIGGEEFPAPACARSR